MKKIVFLILAFPLWTNAQQLMDSLTYSYDIGNRLLKVEDRAEDYYGFTDDAVKVADTLNDYTYDANGNLTSDANKGITNITYNYLNVPTLIAFEAPVGRTRNIAYVYDASGRKLERKVTDIAYTETDTVGTIITTQYAGDYVYEKTENLGEGVDPGMGMRLKYIKHAEGYAVPNEAGGFDDISI